MNTGATGGFDAERLRSWSSNSPGWFQYFHPDGKLNYRSQVRYWREFGDWHLMVHETGYVFEHLRMGFSKRSKRPQIHALWPSRGIVAVLFHKMRVLDFESEAHHYPSDVTSFPEAVYVNIGRPFPAVEGQALNYVDLYVDVVRQVVADGIVLTERERKFLPNATPVEKRVSVEGVEYLVYKPCVIDQEDLEQAHQLGVIDQQEAQSALTTAEEIREMVEGRRSIFAEASNLFGELLRGGAVSN